MKKKSCSLKKGDTVMIIAGGNSNKRPNKGKTGKVLGFSGKNNDYVLVEGLNMMTKHKRATQPGESGGVIRKEGPVHVSNVMYFSEKLGKPCRLKHMTLQDGKKVRGYMNKKTGEFEQIDA